VGVVSIYVVECLLVQLQVMITHCDMLCCLVLSCQQILALAVSRYEDTNQGNLVEVIW